MISPRFYTYIFFEVPDEFREQCEISPAAASFFQTWQRSCQLKENPDARDFDMNDPDLTMLRMAENEGIEVCVFRFHDLDILEIEWNQPGPEEASDSFWQRCTDELEEQLPNLPASFGMICACFAHMDDISPEDVMADWPTADISGAGILRHIGKQHYLLLSDGKDPANFLGRDLPVMSSCIRKLEFQSGELEKIRTQNRKSEKHIQELLSVIHPGEIREKFPDMKESQSYFQRNTARLTKLRETLDINILTLENYCKKYADNSLFVPLLAKARKTYKQAGYDLSYARAGLEEIDSHLRFLDLKIQDHRLKIEQRRERGQRRIEWGLAVIGVFLGIGGATTNLDMWNTTPAVADVRRCAGHHSDMVSDE